MDKSQPQPEARKFPEINITQIQKNMIGRVPFAQHVEDCAQSCQPLRQQALAIMHGSDPDQYKENTKERVMAEMLTLPRAMILEDVDQCFAKCKKPV